MHWPSRFRHVARQPPISREFPDGSTALEREKRKEIYIFYVSSIMMKGEEFTHFERALQLRGSVTREVIVKESWSSKIYISIKKIKLI